MGDDAELYMEMLKDGFWDTMPGHYTHSYDDYENYEDFEDEDEEDIDYSRYFFIDYENVHYDGLNGILKLSEDDCVRIYYSEAANTMTFGLHRRIMASVADFEYVKVQILIKNAVDCQILSDLENRIRKDRYAEYYIVSKDTDFDKDIAKYRGQRLKVKRILEIAKKDEDLTEKTTGVVSAQPVKQPVKPVKQPEKMVKQPVKPVKQSEKMAKQPAKSAQSVQPKKTEKEKREAQVRTFFGQNFKDKIYKEHKEEIIQAILTCKTKQAVNNSLMRLYPGEIVSLIYKTIQPLIKDYPGK